MSRKLNLTAASMGLVAVLLLVSFTAGAALSFVRSGTSGVQTSASTASFTFNMTDVEFVMAFVHTTRTGAENDTVTTRTLGGQAMTPLPNGDLDSHSNPQYVRIQTFYYVNPAGGGLTGNQTVSVSTTSSTASVAVSVIGLAGVDRSDPIQASANNYGWNPGPAAVTLDTTMDGSWVVFSGAKNLSTGDALAASTTPTLTTTSVWATTHSTMTFTGWYGGPVADATNSQGVTFTGVSTPQRGVVIGASLRPRDTTPPTVVSITRVHDTPTNRATVDYTVTFSEPVTGVDSVDFTVPVTGTVSGAYVSAVSPDTLSNVRTVTVNTGASAGSGTLQLNLVDNDTIVDGAGNPLGGPGMGTVYYGEAYDIDKDPPTGCSVSINGGAEWTNSVDVTLTLTSTGAMQMRFSNGVTWFPWEDVDTTKDWTLISGDGEKTVGAEFRDAVGNVAPMVTNTIKLDETKPTGEISINGGDPTTSLRNVTIGVTADADYSGVTQMQFSGDGTSTGWVSCVPTYPFTLDTGDGTKYVYAQLRDDAGNVSDEIIGDSIILDTTGPVGTVTINGGVLNTTNPDVTLTLEAIDDYSTVEFMFMSISNDNTNWPDPVPYATTYYPWTLAGPDGLNTVYVKFIDDLGNWTQVSDDIMLDTTPPSGEMLINGGAQFTNTLSVSVLVTTTDTNVEVQYRSDGVDWTGWQAYDGAADNFTVSAGDGVKTVYAQLRDQPGNVSDVEPDTIILDQTLPTGSVVIAGGATAVNPRGLPVELTVSALDPGDTASGVAFMQFSNFPPEDNAWSTAEDYATAKNWWLTDGEGPKTVYVKFIDNAGNESTGADGAGTVIVDTTPPSAPVVTSSGAPRDGLPDITNSLQPIWSWTSGGGGNLTFRYQLDAEDEGGWTETTDATYTPAELAEGVYTMYVQERDEAGNWSDSGERAVEIDVTNPNAPIVSGPAVTRNLQPTWSWLSGGGDGVGQYRLQLNGEDEEGWTDVNDQLSFTPGEPLADKTTHTLNVQERDAAGNWSDSGWKDIVVNSELITDPTVSGVTPTNDTTPLWTWISGGGTEQYRYQLDATDPAGWTEIQDATSWEPTVPLGEGVYILYVEEQLEDLSWSNPGFFAITVDLTSPSAPIVTSSGTPRDGLPDITNSLQPVWSWTSGGDGNGTFRYQLDGTDEGGWTETDLAFAPAATLAEGVYTMYVEERDYAGNWSESGERAVEIDTTNPIAPVVSAPARTSSLKPMWTWVSGGNGNGTYRCQLGAEDEGGWTVTTALAFVPDSDLAEGAYTLFVQERDDAANWSASGSAPVSIEPNAPNAPVVTSPNVTSNPQPTWTWVSGGGTGNYRYQLDSEVGEWTETTDTSFTPDPLSEGSHTVYVQEASFTEVWSEPGRSTTLVDFTAPSAPAVTGPGITADATPTWTWVPGGGGNGTYRYQLDSTAGAWNETTDTQFTPSENLAAGPHILYVQERDDAANWSPSGSWSVSVKLAGPEPPVVSGPEVTNDLRPRWTWVSGGNGNGRFRYQLNSEAGTWQLTTAISFRPMAPLTDGAYILYVQEQDSLGNWSESGQWTIVIDTVPPAPPLLTGATPVRTKQPTWTWTSGGGGAGLFRVQIDSEDDAWTVTTELSYSPPLELEKNAHTLYAQEADAAGNWSVSSLYTIVIDPNAVLSPIVSGVTPTNVTTPEWTWEAAPDSGGNGQFSYRLDGGDWVVASEQTFTPAAPLAQGDHVLEVRESDQFNEWSWPGSFTITINLGLPVITIVGANPAQVSAGTTYTDEHATAVDGDDNDITSDIVVTGLPVDINVVGSYSVTYSVSDDSGNKAEAVRTVNVVSGVTEVSIAAPVAGATLYMPAQGMPVLLALTSVAPDDTQSVTYTFDGEEVGSATEAPWLVVVQLTSAVGLFGEHVIGAAAVEAEKDSSDSVTLTIADIPAGADADANGIPDNPFATLGAGDMWAMDGVAVLRAEGAVSAPTGAPNVVALANPSNANQRLLAAVSPSVLVEAEDSAVVILKAADDLVELLGAEEAALVAAPPLGYLVAGNFYGTVNVAVSEDGANFWNLEAETLEDYPVVVTAQDNLTADVDLLLHGAEVMDGGELGVFIGIPEAASWGNDGVVELNVVDGAATATLKALGLVAAFEPEPAEGEGEGEDEGPGGCFAANLQPPTFPRSGDGLVLLLAVALLLPVLRLRMRTNPVR